MKQKVALALGSGGARGLAHIGVIEELEKGVQHFVGQWLLYGSASGLIICFEVFYIRILII